MTGLRMRHQGGFSLIELMVALVIGLVVTVVITQVLALFEGQQRTTSGGSDTQTNGSLALYAIQREALMAGWGLPVFDAINPPLNCAMVAGTDISLVTITDTGTATDSITVRYGDSPFAGIPVTMLTGTAAPVALVDTTMACQVGNDALVTNGTACTLTKVAAVNPAGPPQITLAANSNVAKDSRVSCLGTWRQVTYSVNGNRLMRSEVAGGVAAAPMPIGSDIVGLKAQYGISAAANDNHVIQWVNADAAGGWSAPSVANRNRIKAVRVAVVARNGLLEKADVTNPCSSTTAASPTGLCAWDATSANPVVASPAPSLDLSGDPEWRRYRYQVFETIIPLRNMVWSRGAL